MQSARKKSPNGLGNPWKKICARFFYIKGGMHFYWRCIGYYESHFATLVEASVKSRKTRFRDLFIELLMLTSPATRRIMNSIVNYASKSIICFHNYSLIWNRFGNSFKYSMLYTIRLYRGIIKHAFGLKKTSYSKEWMGQIKLRIKYTPCHTPD